MRMLSKSAQEARLCELRLLLRITAFHMGMLFHTALPDNTAFLMIVDQNFGVLAYRYTIFVLAVIIMYMGTDFLLLTRNHFPAALIMGVSILFRKLANFHPMAVF